MNKHQSSVSRYPRAAVFEPYGLPIYIDRALHRVDQMPHDHDFMELVLVLGGSAQHHTHAGTASLQAGDVLVLRPGVWHAYLHCRNLRIYNCIFGQELLGRELAWLMDDPWMGYLLWSGPLSAARGGFLADHLPPESRKPCERAMARLDQAINRTPRPGRGAAIGMLTILLDELARSLPSARQRATLHPRPHPAISRAVHLLQADLTRPWTTASLAALLHLNRSYLIRLFNTATGLPPLAYLSQLRAERAAHLLLRGDLSIKEIGAEVGWPAQHYFARRFKAHFGLNASDYRRRFDRLRTQPPPA